MKPAPLNDITTAPDPNSLPMKWQAAAPDVGNLPTLNMAIAAFRRDIENSGNGLVSEFYSRELRLCVFGCKLAIECAADQTIRLRRRPPGLPWICSAEAVSTWPEIRACGRVLMSGYAAASWLHTGAAMLFEAWSRDFLPTGYRYPNPLNAVNAALPELADFDLCTTRWHVAIRSVLPEKFWAAFGLSFEAWTRLPDIAAPLRVWNAHCNELMHVEAKEPWVRAAVRVLMHAPPFSHFGSTVEQSIKTLVATAQPKTVWRFHRDTEFALIPELPMQIDLPEIDCNMLLGEGGRYAGLLIGAAVKALSMRHAQRFFLYLGGIRRFKRMVKAVREANCTDAHMAKLPAVFALAWREFHVDTMLGRFMHKNMETVIAWLAHEGFARGFPAPNATWSSLVEHADRWEVINRLQEAAQAAQSAWRASIPVWRAGAVKFTAIESRNALEVEGEQMRHCAAQYFRQCALGTSAIYRIEGTLPNGKPARATVEFVKMPAGKGWQIAQIKGRKNREVHDSLQHMAARLAHELGGPGLIRN